MYVALLETLHLRSPRGDASEAAATLSRYGTGCGGSTSRLVATRSQVSADTFPAPEEPSGPDVSMSTVCSDTFVATLVGVATSDAGPSERLWEA